MWQRLGRPERFVVREYGAGTGALFLTMLDGLRAKAPTRGRDPYQPVDLMLQTTCSTSVSRPRAQRAVATDARISHSLASSWPTSSSMRCPSIASFDGRDGLREIYVDWHDGGSSRSPAELSDRASSTGSPIAESSWPTASAPRSAWPCSTGLAQLGRELERGYVLDHRLRRASR